MGAFEEFKQRQERYLARAAVLGNKAGTDVFFLSEIKSFVRELSSFKEKNKAVLDPNRRAILVLWRNHWLSFLEGSSMSKLAA